LQTSYNILVIGVMFASFSLTSCHIYEDNFTAMGKYYNEILGHYGQAETCRFPWAEEEPAQVSLMDYYRIHDKSCGIAEVRKDKNTFTLVPLSDSCKLYQTEDDGGESFAFVEDFSITVTKLQNDKISVNMPNEKTQVFERCVNLNK